MATKLQRKALDKLVEASRTKKRVIAGQVLKEAGYAEGTQIKPSQVFESKGFIELCDELGLTDNLLTKALVTDIKKKPGKRTRELELGFKVRGRLKEETHAPTFNLTFIEASQLKRVASRVLDGDSESAGTPDRLLDSNGQGLHT